MGGLAGRVLGQEVVQPLELARLDAAARYPLGADFFHIDHGADYFAFFARLAHNGYPSRLTRNFELSVDAFVEFTLEHPEWFTKPHHDYPAADIPVPKDALVEHDATSAASAIPVTYVPARNALFLCYALAWAETLGAQDIFAGMNALDYSGYPDCRPPFLDAFAAMARLGTKAGVEGRPLRIRAPLLRLGKAEIIRLGTLLGVDYGLTHSCYDPTSALACGHCDSCLLRQRGFAQAGVPDPTRYI